MLLISDGPGRYCTNRLFEWFAVVYLVNTGLAILINNPGDSGVLRLILSNFSDHRYVGLYLFLLGGFRAALLVVNGRAPVWGPRLRCTTSLLGSFVWSYAVVIIGTYSLQTHIFYAGLFQYSAVAVFEFIAACRSAFDSGRKVVVGSIGPT